MVRISLFLNALAACIALTGYLPLLPYLGTLPRFFFPAALAAAFYLQRTGRALPVRVLTPLSVVLFLYVAASFSLDRLVGATGDLLVLFLGIRLLGERSGRNYLQVFALSLFCLAASSLYEISAVFLIYLLLLILLVAVSLVLLAFHGRDPDLVLSRHEARKVLGISVLIPVASLPILLVLFMVLPRTQYPLWNAGVGTAAKTGFSETVRPGEAPAVAEVKGVVLRAVSPPIPDDRLYWRGIVLNAFEGDAWVRVPVPGESPPLPGGSTVTQEIYPERSLNLYLPALNVTRSISGVRHNAAADAVFSLRRAPEKKVKYLAVSGLTDTLRARGPVDREFYLALPGTVPRRLLAKGTELSRLQGGETEVLNALERFFSEQRIRYSNTGLPTGNEALDDFLFDSRRGNCEYFASSYAMLLRLAGIPSRLVGGYRGGNYNRMGGYYLVTEDMAHVWVEAYLEGEGWRSIDPSSFAAGKVGTGQGKGPIALYLDAIGFYWDKAVVTYDLEKQMALARRAGEKARGLSLPAASGRAAAAFLAIVLPLVALYWWRSRRPPSVQARVLRRMLRALEKRHPGEARDGEGLFELAARLGDPDLGEFAALYGEALYRDRPLGKEELARLHEIIRRLAEHRP